MGIFRSRLGKVGALTGALLALTAVTAVSALAGPGLPRTYQNQRVDSPAPALAGGFGYPLVNLGDLTGDNEDDLGTTQPTGQGVLFLYNGETGQRIDTVNAPDPGGAGNKATVDEFIDRLGDIGACDNPPADADPDQTCDSTRIGGPDGVPEILYGAQGVDVGGVTDVGRAYIIDGKTRAVLKRLDMPPEDRAELLARQTENPTIKNPAGTASGLNGGLGRTVFSPRGLPPCEGNGGVGACDTTVPKEVRIGDMDGGGLPEIVAGANNFPERGTSAHPDSHCAKADSALCRSAGRTYIYRGEDIAGSDPAAPLEDPYRRLKNPVAQGDEVQEAGAEQEIFGHVQFPMGDVGKCRTPADNTSETTFPAVAAGDRCSLTSATNVPDGKPEVLVAAHRTDLPAGNPDASNFDVGVVFLIDGATGSILYRYDHPEPQPGSIFGFTLHQTFATGDLGPTSTPSVPDAVIPAMRQNVAGRTAAGRGYAMSGNFKLVPNINIGQINDPTPTTGGNFSAPTEAVGDLVPATARNELLVGGFASNAARGDAITDVHFYSAFSERALQSIGDPDQQPGSAFGVSVTPLGDLNEDGFLDFAAGASRWDSPDVGTTRGTTDQGRFYIFRSDNSTTPPPQPTRAGRNITLGASPTRTRRGGTVRLTGRIRAVTNPARCQPNQVVALQRALPGSGRFATFARARTNGSGVYTLSTRVTRTHDYRAVVSQTAHCLAATSRKQRVTVSG